MKTAQPLCCTSAAYAAFARYVTRIETPLGLLRAASALAGHHDEALVNNDVERVLNGFAKMVRGRVRGAQPQARIAHLHAYLFEELGFAGNSDDYYNPSNGYLSEVIDTRRGLPISLSLIYKFVAHKLDLTVNGVGLPGHFVVAVQTYETEASQKPIIVDCYDSGRVLSVEDCKDRVESIFGDTVDWNEKMLEPVSHRMWLSRMIQNLLHIFTTNQQWNDVAAMLELQMVLWPKQSQLKRDLGLVLARIDMPKPASMWLGEYLKANPDDPEHDELSDLLGKLGEQV